MSTPVDGAFPRAKVLYHRHIRVGLSLTIALLLSLGLATLALAQHPPVEKAPHGHGTPPGAHGDHGKAGHGHDHGKGGHDQGHGDGHHKNPCKGVTCAFGTICKYGKCEKVIDNWYNITGFGKDKAIKNGPLLIAIFNFICLIALLVYFARKPIGQFLETRHTTIKNDLEEAAELRDQARQKLAQIEAKLKGITDEVEEIKQGVADDAEFEKKRIITHANEEADRIIAQAESSLEREIRRARKKLEAEAIEGALKVAEEIVRKQLGEADRKRINENFISQITSSGGGN